MAQKNSDEPLLVHEACNISGQYCTNCEAFHDHSTPIQTSHSRTGISGCPECLTDSLRYVVEEVGDSRTITGGYIPSGQRADAIELSSIGIDSGQRVRITTARDRRQSTSRSGITTNWRSDNGVVQVLVDLDTAGRDWFDAADVEVA